MLHVGIVRVESIIKVNNLSVTFILMRLIEDAQHLVKTIIDLTM